ncbi:molybdate ABC transporter substrate-binding protein [Thermomonospora catenispora]|uniref:molybdate ABC transporter substrate-binding protein n=1 Tax=Thermomonospora catenispora TaxID=2493090 RepID=UPI0011222EC2|nr:molybdate ABC transporter substrate-binding protein [Thermomonospora catenispora]TNY34628.1 molybdate ABC transporter substrate-binding protein [Thermomonospora catenispora]
MALRPLLRRLVASAALLPALLSTAACGEPSGPVRLTVFASSSLTEAFAELASGYERERGVRIRPVLSASLDLVERLEDRPEADVLITGDRAAMEDVAELLGDARVIARTSLTIAVAPGNPQGIRGIADLARPGLRVVLGAPLTPVGRYARSVLAKEGVTVRTASEEIGSRAVLTKIRTGEADAGLVYITDLRTAGVAAGSVPIPADQNVTVEYPAAPVRASGHPEAAEAFVEWLTTAPAREILHRHGFALP